MNYVADATSRRELREFANEIRAAFRLDKKPYFPIVEFLENAMVQLFPEFNWEIVPDSELFGVEGLTLPNEHLIMIPETVYMDAVHGFGRARFSIAHEVAHYFLVDSTTVALCRSDVKLPTYRKPEWQADTLAGELLVPPDLSIGMNADRIVDVFGVSFAAAKVHINVKMKEGLP
jgi:hypothetical protein